MNTSSFTSFIILHSLSFTKFFFVQQHSSTDTVPSKHFHPFLRLPSKVRELIWKKCAVDRKRHRWEIYEFDPLMRDKALCIPEAVLDEMWAYRANKGLWQACFESRRVMQKHEQQQNRLAETQGLETQPAWYKMERLKEAGRSRLSGRAQLFED
ncbi:hypothetical protein FVEN_g2191 [Fusarium venenatum]|uniref:2EXR domain-containing protein n=1 Tax=Fusarium venenatum TaxID=56646 RepID=A0A2L2T1L5_9HYPO|nr:uncharacterized protein FVRRES_12614 [Fusarium venenatum]KAG8360288.1 hypothetical protein FVEN_g2191 [Fusarium venenatum]CEI39923.1 unnamed protein product [Fusarium venenatum]